MGSPTQMYAVGGAFASWLSQPIKLESFKAAPEFCGALDNCSKEQGQAYLERIETEFPEVSIAIISEFAARNDKVGDPQMCVFISSRNDMIFCSPANLRYAYIALTVLKDVRARNCTTIAEIGGGYGGLWLAVSAFRECMGVYLTKYTIVELPMVVPLAQAYISAMNHEHASEGETLIECSVNTVDFACENVNAEYIVSAYCFTELAEKDQVQYRTTLISRAKHGMIVWQTAFGSRISRAENILGHIVRRVSLENPQTATPTAPNYVVIF
jgi:hypothetical protein